MKKLSQTQIRINISTELKQHLKIRAATLGVTMAEYIRHLIMKSIEENDEISHQIPIPENSVERFRNR